MMLSRGIDAGNAAIQVGYESASQFSREYKRYFGDSPSIETTKVRGAESH